MKKRGIITLVLLLVWLLPMQAQTVLDFVRLDRSPRTSAFAGAGAASASPNAFNAFNNAAGLSFMQKEFDAEAGVQLWQMSNEVDRSTNFSGAVASRFGKLGVALAGTYQKSVPADGYTPCDWIASLGASYAVLDFLSIGLNLRYAAQHFAPEAKVGGFSGDLSILGKPGAGFTLAAGVGMIGPKVKGSTNAYPQASYGFVGAGWKAVFAADHNVELLVDGAFDFDGGTSAAFGAEYAFRDIVFVRAGYRVAAKDAVIPSHLGVGIGLQLFGIRLDASYLTASDIVGNTVNIGLGYSF